jgi:hypothetical protein
MKLLKLVTLALTASITSSVLGWKHNNTPYHMIVSFNRIGLFDNPVTMTPNSSTTVSSWESIIDYCYAGAHLLIQPVAGQKVPQTIVNGKPAAITAGKMPNPNALQQLRTAIIAGAATGGSIGAAYGAITDATIDGATMGFVAGLMATPAGAFIGGAAGLAAGTAAGTVTGGALGGAIGTVAGAVTGLIGGLISVTENEVAYNAPYVSITPLDACWNRTITLNYNVGSNQIIASVE